MIKTQGLTKKYADKTVLNDVNLEFVQGKIYGFLGRNGAGKTTLINIITNRIFATSGTCTISDLDSVENDFAQGKIFCITEKSDYPPTMKVSHAIKWAKRFYPSFDTDYAHQLSQKFNLDTTKKFKHLSTGYRTIAKVVLTLASRAEVMILDEPVLGIDALYRKVFYEELKKTQIQNNNLIILATHILDEAESVIDEVIIIKAGSIVYNDALSNLLKKNKSLEEFYVNIYKEGSASV